MADGWVPTPTIQLFTTILVVGSYTDPTSNTVFKRQRGMRTPYPPRRVLSPFQGDTSNCPSLKGKGDRPNGRWMGSYTDHTILYYHSGG